MSLLLLLLVFAVLVNLYRLHAKVRRLEESLKALEAASAVPAAVAAGKAVRIEADAVTAPAADNAASLPLAAKAVPVPPFVSPTPGGVEVAEAPTAGGSGAAEVPAVALDNSATALWTLLKRNLFAVAGVGLLLVGFAILLASVSWGNWLGPAARIGLVLATSAALGAMGVKLSTRQPLWAQVVQGGAAALGYLGLHVAVSSYELISTIAALAGFTAISAWTVWRACKEDSKALAAVGFLGAYAAPVLALNASGSITLHLSFGLVVSLASLWVSYRRHWVEVASQAFVCAAGLAAVVISLSSEPLTPFWQQAFLHAYALPFAWCAVAWLRHQATSAREEAVVVTWIGLTAACYLALQHWLLERPAFSLVAGAASLAIAAIAWRLPRAESVTLRETAWVVAALYAASAVLGADVGHVFKGLVLFGQGVLMLLATRNESRVRAWLARGLVVAGALGVWPLAGTADASVWALGLLTLGALAGSLRLSQASRRRDSTLLVAVVGISLLAAGNVLSARLLSGTATEAGMLPLLVLALASALAAACALIRSRTGGWNEVLPLVWMPAVFWFLTLLAPAQGVERWHALALSVSLLGTVSSVGVYRTRSYASQRSLVLSRAHAVGVLLVALLPAIVAYKLQNLSAPSGFTKLTMSLVVIGLAAYALVFCSRLYSFRAAHLPVFGQGNWSLGRAVFVALPLSILVLLAPFSMPLSAAPWLVPTAIAAALPVWVVAAPARWRGCTLVGALFLGGVSAVVLGFSLPQAVDAHAWRRAVETVALALVWTVAGVLSLFLASRGQERGMWQLAAAGCVLALLTLLVAATGWNFSMLAGSVAIIAIGALFLLAGYLAPLPPLAAQPPSGVAAEQH